jgi:hypothetical protein
VQTLTPSLQTRLVTGILLERMITGIRRWSSENRGVHRTATSSASGRLNCENMPVIPTSLVRSNLNDPRRIPDLLVWKDERDGRIREAVRLACFVACRREGNGYVELKRTDGSATILQIV